VTTHMTCSWRREKVRLILRDARESFAGQLFVSRVPSLQSVSLETAGSGRSRRRALVQRLSKAIEEKQRVRPGDAGGRTRPPLDVDGVFRTEKREEGMMKVGKSLGITSMASQRSVKLPSSDKSNCVPRAAVGVIGACDAHAADVRQKLQAWFGSNRPRSSPYAQTTVVHAHTVRITEVHPPGTDYLCCFTSTSTVPKPLPFGCIRVRAEAIVFPSH
jgi:hypothetical protein